MWGKGLRDRPDDKFLRAVGGDRIASRQIDELIGLARGIAADGIVSVAEAQVLHDWLVAAQSVIDQPLVRDLLKRVDAVLRDNQVDAEEASDLLSILKQLTESPGGAGELLRSTTLPLDNPQPDLSFSGKIYCFTGTFVFGQRKACEEAVSRKGATCAALTQKTDFLVVGTYVTESWKHSAFGNKILHASEWRERGIPIAIVSEEHWTRFVRDVH